MVQFLFTTVISHSLMHGNEWDGSSYHQHQNFQGFSNDLDGNQRGGTGGETSSAFEEYPPPHFDMQDPSIHDHTMAEPHGNQIYGGPSPVMLSSPYSKNASFATGQPLDSSQMSSSSSATQGSSAGSTPAFKRGAAQRANSSPYRQPASRTSRKQQRKSESDEGASTSSKPRAGRGKKPPHELLSEAEKKANHIASEQKRRQNIRVGFDQLVEIVPALSQSHRSEALILQKSVDHIHKLVAAKNELKERVRELQTVLGEMPPDDDSSEDEINYSY